MIWLLGDSWIEWQSLLYWRGELEGPWIDHTNCLQTQLKHHNLDSVVLAKGGASVWETLDWAEWYALKHTPTHIVVLWTELGRMIQQHTPSRTEYSLEIQHWAELASNKLIELERTTGARVSVYGAQASVHTRAQQILGDRVKIADTRWELCNLQTPHTDCLSSYDHQFGGSIRTHWPSTTPQQEQEELERIVDARTRMYRSKRFPDGGHPDAQYYQDLAEIIAEDHRANV